MFDYIATNQLSHVKVFDLLSVALDFHSKFLFGTNLMLLVLLSSIILACLIIIQFVVLTKHQSTKLKLKNMEQQYIEISSKVESLIAEIEWRRGSEHTYIEETLCDMNDSSSVEDLISSSILTDEDWAKFQESFNRLHPGVTDELLMKYENLTQAELRYLLLSYLNLSHKRMAALLGISSDSLRVTWYRLRKKFELESSYSVADFWEDFAMKNRQNVA